MSQPWTPMPNPGGRYREFVRKTVAEYLVGLNIAGVGHVYPGTPLTELMDEGQPGSLQWANISVHTPSSVKMYEVQTGPTDYGGYLGHWDVELTLKHRCVSVEDDDWAAAEDDHDRILDEIETGLKGPGRDLGRPDVVLQSAAWPTDSIRDETDHPIYADGVRDQWSRIFFTVSIYMQQQP